MKRLILAAAALVGAFELLAEPGLSP